MRSNPGEQLPGLSYKSGRLTEYLRAVFVRLCFLRKTLFRIYILYLIQIVILSVLKIRGGSYAKPFL
jgi:hypothetical protein